MDSDRFAKLPVMGILRGIELAVVEPLMETIAAAGLETIEITMNTAQAPALIKKAVRVAGSRLMIGAGTVLDIAALSTALDAGATFIVMPTFVPEVMEYCVKNAVPVFPGALSPQEAYHCWKYGATMVKVFPASVFGPQYFKSLHGPFPAMKLLAVGGVSCDNVGEYFACGADGVAIGESVFNNARIRANDFAAVREALACFLNAVPLPGRKHVSLPAQEGSAA
jgi:2-dehydro-3-deoxyphosphogluconate aldolase/(4S)-4-hydroxy-2-oxoglutarate aldolase